MLLVIINSPQKTGSNSYQHDFVFSKVGDEITGDFIAPLGTFSNRGSDIIIDISTPDTEQDSGSAHFVLAGKKTTSETDPLVTTKSQTK